MSKIPTLWPVKYKCGHTEKRDLGSVPPTKRRAAAASDFWATQAAGDGMVCSKCFRTRRAQDRDKWLRQMMLDIEQFETEHALPELTGTDKQLTSGLIESARRDRYSVLSELTDPETAEQPDRGDELLAAAKTLTWAGWWTNNLGYRLRKEHDYGQDEYIELILDGAEQEANREPAERIINENPHDWTGDRS